MYEPRTEPLCSILDDPDPLDNALPLEIAESPGESRVPAHRKVAIDVPHASHAEGPERTLRCPASTRRRACARRSARWSSLKRSNRSGSGPRSLATGAVRLLGCAE